MKPSKQEHGDQCRPDLNQQGVFGSADEGFDFQILFEGFEKHFDLPALAVNVRDGGSAKTQMVGQQNNRFLVFRVPNLDAAQRKWAFPLALNTRQRNQLIPQNVSVLGQGTFVDDFDAEIMTKGESQNTHPG